MAANQSSFDLLWILAALSPVTRELDGSEAHLFAYLACLLAVYDGREPTWWGYAFTTTRVGAPFSSDLDQAQDVLVGSGLIEQRDTLLVLTDAGGQEAAELALLPSSLQRLSYLRAATNSALALPLPSITNAISREPQLSHAVPLRQLRALLDDTGLVLLEPHFDSLRTVLGRLGAEDKTAELSIHGIFWLTYLAHQAELVDSARV
jgi:hypothetical protein